MVTEQGREPKEVARDLGICIDPLRKQPKGLIFHSDQGVQYAAVAFRERLESYGIRQSMSRKGDPYDNAVAENQRFILLFMERLGS